MDFDFLEAQPVTLQRLLTAASQQAPVYAMANELLLPSRESAPPAPHPPTPRASVPRASTPHASALHAPTPHAPAPHTSAPHAPAPHASVPHAYAPHPLEGQNNPTAPNTMPTMPPLGLGPPPIPPRPGMLAPMVTAADRPSEPPLVTPIPVNAISYHESPLQIGSAGVMQHTTFSRLNRTPSVTHLTPEFLLFLGESYQHHHGAQVVSEPSYIMLTKV